MATPKKKKETFNRFGLYDSLHKQHICFSDSRVSSDSTIFLQQKQGITKNVTYST